VLLKVHATGLATGKNTRLLGMLDQIEMEMYIRLPVVTGSLRQGRSH